MSYTARESIVVRRLWPTDRAAFTDHLLRLDVESRAKRFHGLLSDAAVRDHAARAFRLGAVIHGAFEGAVLLAAAELHAVRSRTAEAAFSVERERQGTGLGTALFRRLLVAARNRGVRRLVLHCLPGNLAMLRLCARFGAAVRIEDGEGVGVLDPRVATPLSWLDEVVADGTGIAKAMLDVPLALWPKAA